MIPTERLPCLTTLEAVRTYVRDRLCDHDRIDPAVAEIRQATISRRGRPCGMMFQLSGPRQLRTYGLWVEDENRILFYGSNGQRFADVQLVESPNSAELAAA